MEAEICESCKCCLASWEWPTLFQSSMIPLVLDEKIFWREPGWAVGKRRHFCCRSSKKWSNSVSQASQLFIQKIFWQLILKNHRLKKSVENINHNGKLFGYLVWARRPKDKRLVPSKRPEDKRNPNTKGPRVHNTQGKRLEKILNKF